MKKITVFCCGCKKSLEISKSTRSHWTIFCSPECKEKYNIRISNEKWLKKKKRVPNSRKLGEKHPWLKRFIDMVE